MSRNSESQDFNIEVLKILIIMKYSQKIASDQLQFM